MKKYLKISFYFFVRLIPFFSIISVTKNHQAPVKLSHLFFQRILRINGNASWPVHFTSTVSFPQNISLGKGSAPGYSPGCYIQAFGKIDIGDHVLIGPNVGIITANHDIHDTSRHLPSKVALGDYCWIGMNSVILPNVVLGPHTVVAAGSVVTKSFPAGHVVLAGNPAKAIRSLNKSETVKWTRN